MASRAHGSRQVVNENAKVYLKCPCPGNPQNLIRKQERGVLTNLQAVAPNRRESQCGGYKTVRSKSWASTASLASSSGCGAESTRISQVPYIKQPLLDHSKITFRSQQSGLSPCISRGKVLTPTVASTRVLSDSETRTSCVRNQQKSVDYNRYTQNVDIQFDDDVFDGSQNYESVVPQQSSSKCSSSRGTCGRYTNSASQNQRIHAQTVSRNTPDIIIDSNYETLSNQIYVTLSQSTMSTINASSKYDFGRVTVSRPIVVDRESTRNNEFVNSTEYLQDLKRSNTASHPVTSTVAHLPKKLTLRKTNPVAGHDDKILYPQEYIMDIVHYIYESKNKFLLSVEYVETCIQKKARTKTINWLLQVQSLIAPNLETAYYGSVRIFDYVLVKLMLREEIYPLVAIVSLWILLKYVADLGIRVAKIHRMCSGRYTEFEILRMERAILKAARFSLNISDPLDFLNIYLKNSNLQKEGILIKGANFVLECSTLFETYSLVDAAVTAAGALYLAHKAILGTQCNISFGWCKPEAAKHHAIKILHVAVKYCIMENLEPAKKYMCVEKHFVPKYFY